MRWNVLLFGAPVVTLASHLFYTMSPDPQHDRHVRRADRVCSDVGGYADRANVIPMVRAWLTVCNKWLN